MKLAPQIFNFYAREREIDTLCNWIFTKKIRLISLLGLSGMGKTTLVKRFIDLNLDKFEVIIWKNLNIFKCLDEIILEVLKVKNSLYSKTSNSEIGQFFEILTAKKCLIIFDNVESIFARGQLSGQYLNEYQEYKNFFKMIKEIEHQSSLILISQEQCSEMECLDEPLSPVKCLELSGLYNTELLKILSLKDEESWLNLVNLYEGNPNFLKSIAMLINKNYAGKVTDFLDEKTLHITNNMQCDLAELFNRLSPQEQQIVYQLSKFDQPISRKNLEQSLELSLGELNNSLQSLQQRCLVTTIKGDIVLFDLVTVFKQYVRNSYSTRQD